MAIRASQGNTKEDQRPGGYICEENTSSDTKHEAKLDCSNLHIESFPVAPLHVCHSWRSQCGLLHLAGRPAFDSLLTLGAGLKDALHVAPLELDSFRSVGVSLFAAFPAGV